MTDGGTDGGMDAGVDGGTDGGRDAGALVDAGSGVEDGGVTPLLPDLGFRGGGCGCTSTDAGSVLALSGLLGLLRRRRVTRS